MTHRFNVLSNTRSQGVTICDCGWFSVISSDGPRSLAEVAAEAYASHIADATHRGANDVD